MQSNVIRLRYRLDSTVEIVTDKGVKTFKTDQRTAKMRHAWLQTRKNQLKAILRRSLARRGSDPGTN